MKIIPKTAEEIEKIKVSCQIVSKAIAAVSQYIKPGVTTLALDKIAEEVILDHGARPAFKNYRFTGDSEVMPFPATLCTSINEVVVHGIPASDRVLQEGDIISIDCGVEYQGYYGDSAYTFKVGEVDSALTKLLAVTRESLNRGIEKAVAGNRMGDLSSAIQVYVESNGFSVVREMVGHGIGQKLHEPPEVPNFGKRGNGLLLTEGMVIAIEPMINLGKPKVVKGADGWTIITADRKPSAHFEHTIVVRKKFAEILTNFDAIQN